MRAMALTRAGQRAVEPVDVETPEPGQVPVAVAACGICRTDPHVVDGDLPDPTIPVSSRS